MAKKLVIVKPPFIAVILLLVSYAASEIFTYRIIDSRYAYLGLLVIACGIALIISGIRMFSIKKTPIIPGEKPKSLIVNGPYRFSRNPIYLGCTIILFGVFTYTGRASFLIAPFGFFAIMNWNFIPYEENLLKKVFGKKYINYKKTARRWI